jgi:hypothetical protein
MTNGLLIYGEIFPHFFLFPQILGSPYSYMTLQLLHSATAARTAPGTRLCTGTSPAFSTVSTGNTGRIIGHSPQPPPRISTADAGYASSVSSRGLSSFEFGPSTGSGRGGGYLGYRGGFRGGFGNRGSPSRRAGSRF